MMSYKRHLRADQWNRIKERLPGSGRTCGVRARGNRQFVEGVLWIGCSGLSAPGQDGVRDPKRMATGIGSCEVRAHPHAAGALQQGPQALGRSRNRLRPRTIDRPLYKARNLLERTFNWIKLRRVATRFETLDLYYAAIVSISCMCKRLA